MINAMNASFVVSIEIGTRTIIAVAVAAGVAALHQNTTKRAIHNGVAMRFEIIAKKI